MIKKIFLVALSFASLGCFGQARVEDSLRKLLGKESAPLRSFDLINKILENEVNRGVNIDTSLCIKMLRLALDLRNDSLVAIGYNMAGSYNGRNGDYQSALEYELKAIPLAVKAKDKRRISSLYFDISLTYIILKNLPDALYYNLKGAENLPGKSSPMYDFMAAQFNRNMVRYYLLQNEPDSALPYAIDLEQEGKKLQSPVIKLPSLFLSGAVYSQLGDKGKAEFYFRNASGLADSISSIGLKWTNDKYFIPYLLQTGKIEEAKQRARLLLELGRVHNNWDVRLTAAEFLRAIFDKTNKTDSAYYFSLLELAMKDSFSRENNYNKVELIAFNERLRSLEEQRRMELNKKQRQQNMELGLVLLGIVLLALLFLYQLRKRRTEMNKKLIGQRDRISRELHDNLGSQLTYIKGNIDWLIDAKGLLSADEEMKKLSDVSETSKTVMDDLRETIWGIKKEQIKLDELSDRIKSFLHKQISHCPGTKAEVFEDIRNNYNFLPTESLNTYRICQEAVMNAIKHAQATQIVLRIISDKERDYFISISDNGKGFDTQNRVEGHYGLLNMAKRAEEDGAVLKIDSGPIEGTTLTLIKFS